VAESSLKAHNPQILQKQLVYKTIIAIQFPIVLDIFYSRTNMNK